MTNTDDIPEKDLQSGEFLTGPMLKHLLLAGVLWPERYLPIREAYFWQMIYYALSRCSSDSIGDIFETVERRAKGAGSYIHPNVTFTIWFPALATALRDNQQISAQDFARALDYAADRKDRWSEKLGTTPRKIADAAAYITTTTSNIYELFDKVLDEAEVPILPFPQKRAELDFGKLDRADRQREGENLIILFFEGIQHYIRGNVSISDFKELKLSKTRKIKANESKEENLNQWICHAVAELDATVFCETIKTKALIAASKLRELIHTNYDNIPKKQALDILDGLLNNLETIDAPKSSQLAFRIREKVANLASSEEDHLLSSMMQTGRRIWPISSSEDE